jgi:hypothetical protein
MEYKKKYLKYKQKYLSIKKNGGGINNNEVCAICQDLPEMEKELNKCVELACGHVFHRECISRQIGINNNDKKGTKCPLCHTQVNVIYKAINTIDDALTKALKADGQLQQYIDSERGVPVMEIAEDSTIYNEKHDDISIKIAEIYKKEREEMENSIQMKEKIIDDAVLNYKGELDDQILAYRTYFPNELQDHRNRFPDDILADFEYRNRVINTMPASPEKYRMESELEDNINQYKEEKVGIRLSELLADLRRREEKLIKEKNEIIIRHRHDQEIMYGSEDGSPACTIS